MKELLPSGKNLLKQFKFPFLKEGFRNILAVYKKLSPLMFFFLILFLDCEKENLYFTHLYGWAKYDTTAINGIILRIRDINPESTSYYRFRADTTGYSSDSLPGFFEMDSVCYATSELQGSQIVAVLVDSLENPGWPSQYWYLDLSGGTDTVVLNLTK